MTTPLLACVAYTLLQPLSPKPIVA